MNKYFIGLITGTAAGIIDVIPMILQNLTWDANLSAFSLWVVCGFLISSSDLKLTGWIKGLLISFLVVLPCAVLIGWKEPGTLIPITVMTTILGSASGWVIEKFSRR